MVGIAKGSAAYADPPDPQTLNLYTYVRNNPLSHADADGHCPGPNGANDPCVQVQVTAKPPTQPAPIKTVTVTDKNGNKLTKTGPSAQIQYTVTVNGTPAVGVQVTEQNQEKYTAGDQTVTTNSNPIEGKATSDSSGEYGDSVGTGQTSSFATPEEATNLYNSIPLTIVDKQTQTLLFPRHGHQPAFTCTVSSTKTITNTPDGRTISPNGYTATTTQPVVTTP